MTDGLRTALDIPLHDLEFFTQDPMAAFAQLRREAPVYWCEPGGFWALTRYDDIVYALRHPELFSSAEGTMRSELFNALAKGTINSTDPPEHAALRRKVNRAFTPRAVAALEPFMRAVAHQVVADIEPGRTYEFVHEIAQPLPTTMIGELVGLPREDHTRVVGLQDRWLELLHTNDGELLAAMAPMMTYLAEFVQARYGRPGDDLITRIVTPDDAGERLSEDEVLRFLFVLIGAGYETTRGQIARGVHDLSVYPDQRQKLLEEPSLLPSAVEEMVRFASIPGYQARVTTQPVVVNSVEMRAGQRVLLFFPSANWDAEIFGDDAHLFRVDRSPNPHIGFGAGDHLCIGASLARMEIRIFFEELLARFRNWELVGEPQPVRSFEFFRMYDPMFVRFER